MRIGLFDSGVGGLTVLKTLKEKYPNNDYIYYGDTLNVPYGNKTKQQLIELAKKDIEFLIKKQIDLIIIACGTVSSNCLTELRSKYNIKILSIIEPTTTYLNNSNYQNVGILATSATINSHIFRNSINKNVYEIEAPKLVPLIEHNELKNIDDSIHEYLDPYINKLDILVLGCTHYPIIEDNIKKIINKDIKILNMASLIELDNSGKGTVNLYFSKIDPTVIKNIKKIINYGIDKPSINDIIINEIS